MKLKDKQAFVDWGAYRKSLLSATEVDFNMPYAEREKKRLKLESDPVAWMLEMFPNYAKYPFAPFHKRAIKRIVNNPEWYEVLSWSRELSKSTVTMMSILYLVLAGKKRNVVMVSNSYDSAERLLEPYRANLDTNQRIKFYYGEQRGVANWEKGDFSTRGGAAFRAVGALQSPRGTRKDEIRPDTVLVDDMDTDQDVLNPEIINKRWNWVEQALIPTRSISEPLLLVFCGNIIAKDCCITRAGAKADHWDIVNIRDKEGKSTWPEKNTEPHIDRVLAQISTKSAQQEYFNNPVAEGTTFKETYWGKVPPLNRFSILVAYGDPAPSNKTGKKTTGSFKSVFLCGICDATLYVITGFLDHVTNADFVEWFYAIKTKTVGRAQVYNYIENNTLQDPFYQQVFIPLFIEAAKTHGDIIGITPDERKKPDKFSRIEGSLEPLNRQGRLLLNEAEKGNPHMVRLADQFLLVQPGLPAPADGPDCVEGAYWILNQKLSALAGGSFSTGHKPINKKRI